LVHPTSMMVIGTFLVTVSFLTITTNAAASTLLSPVPDATFQKLDGTPITISDLKGAVVLINFWGTWCGPCLQEIPHLVRLSHQLKTKGLDVIGIALDSGYPKDIQAFMADHGMDYVVWMGDLAMVKKRFYIMGFPTSLLIDRKGLILKRYFGPQTEEVFKQDVESLLE